VNRQISFTINGKHHVVDADPGARMLDIIRSAPGYTGTKEGCGVGECGACTVLLDGNAVTSCLVLAGQMHGTEIMTVEGLEEHEIGRILQQCFIEEGAIQCGFCTPGMLMSAYALLLNNPCPARDEIREAISGNLCRCTGYIPIINAIQMAAQQTTEK